MSLFRLPKGTGPYCARYYTWGPDGERVRTQKTLGYVSYKAAKTEHDALQAAAHKPRTAAEGLAISQATEAYLRLHASHVAPATLTRVRDLKKTWIDILGDVDVSSITKGDIEGYVAKRMSMPSDKHPGRTIAGGTVNTELGYLRSVCDRALENGFIKFNPFSTFKVRRQPLVIRQEYFEPEELDRFWQFFKGTYFESMVSFFKVLFLTGSRIGELVKLNWFQVDFKRGMVTVLNFKGKRNKTLPMVGELLAILTDLHNKSESKSGPVFIHPRTGKPFERYHLEPAFKRVLAMAGIKKALVPHSLRHSFASIALSRGASIYDVKTVLDHSSVKTTETYYAHRMPSSLGRIMESVQGEGEMGQQTGNAVSAPKP